VRDSLTAQYSTTTPLGEKHTCAACDGDAGAFLIFSSLFTTTYDSDSAHLPEQLGRLRGTDVQALDLFVNAPDLRLSRTVAIGSEAVDENGVRRSNNTVRLVRRKGRLLAARRATSACAS
jgi:hypothetical protein